MLGRLASESAATASVSNALPTPQPLLAAIAGTNTTVTLTGLQRRLQPDVRADSTATNAFGMPTLSSVASVVLSNFLPTHEDSQAGIASSAQPTYSPPSIESLVASSAEDLSSFRDVTFDIFDDEDDLFGSPLAFDASENGLWNGRFVPPPPRPPFFVDEPVLSDGLTTCDLCSWAMPTKSTFIFEGTIEKASELGWPLTLIIVSILSALVGAIIMVTVVRCRRKKASNNRNETHVQWWSRHKRPNGNNNNHLRRSNIYTAHPADSIRGLGPGQPSLSASSSLTAMTAMGASTPAVTTVCATTATPTGAQPPQYYLPHAHYHQPLQRDDYEHEYHQPQELQHQRQHSSSISSARSSPSLPAVVSTMMPMTLPLQLHHHHPHLQQLPHQAVVTPTPTPPPQQPQQHPLQQHLREDTCHWPSATMMVAS